MSKYYCPNCDTEIDKTDKYCKNCGVSFNGESPSLENRNVQDILLIIFITITIIASIVQFVIPHIFSNWYATPIKYTQVGFWIIRDLSFLVIPFCIKHKTLKIIGFILSIIIILTWIGRSVSFLFNSY